MKKRRTKSRKGIWYQRKKDEGKDTKMNANLKTECKKLLDYEFGNGEKKEQPIVIVGPDGTTKTKLRVYAYGGCIGRIATQKGDYNQLAKDKNYGEHLETDEQKYRLKKMQQLKYGEKKGKLLFDSEYLDLILHAARTRFLGEKKGTEERKERSIQTSIVKKHIYKQSDDGWCIVDMEFAISEKNLFSKPDLVVLDKDKGFGLIELKYENESIENLIQHYEKLSRIASSLNVKEQVKELKRRCGYLEHYGLINPEHYDSCAKPDCLWYGFLFVGGEKTTSVGLVKGMAKQHPEIKEEANCRFWWFPEEDLESMNLSFDSADTYEEFTK